MTRQRPRRHLQPRGRAHRRCTGWLVSTLLAIAPYRLQRHSHAVTESSERFRNSQGMKRDRIPPSGETECRGSDAPRRSRTGVARHGQAAPDPPDRSGPHHRCCASQCSGRRTCRSSRPVSTTRASRRGRERPARQGRQCPVRSLRPGRCAAPRGAVGDTPVASTGSSGPPGRHPPCHPRCLRANTAPGGAAGAARLARKGRAATRVPFP